MSNIFNFTPTVLKNLFHKPVTKNYPAEPAQYPERSRGHIEIDIDECISCGKCVSRCPEAAIRFRAGKLVLHDLAPGAAAKRNTKNRILAGVLALALLAGALVGFNLPAASRAASVHLFGGMPVQLGWCNGHNTKLNCLEYHRDSEVNIGTHDFVLLLAKQDQIVDGVLDTALVKAFRVPAGVPVEVYATTLHYAPCHTCPDAVPAGICTNGACTLMPRSMVSYSVILVRQDNVSSMKS